jgi:hypothetical protein
MSASSSPEPPPSPGHPPPPPAQEWWPAHYPRLWPLINSSFGLWFLSSVVLGGLGFLYTQNQNSQSAALKKLELTQAEAARNKAFIAKLDLEIGYRLSITISQLEELDEKVQRCASAASPTNPCESVERHLDALSNSRTRPQTLFPEFSSHSVLALVAELKRVVPVGEQRALEGVIYDMSGIYTMLDVEKASLDRPATVAGALLKKLVLPRWQQGFYYLDCPQKHPFC